MYNNEKGRKVFRFRMKYLKPIYNFPSIFQASDYAIAQLNCEDEGHNNIANTQAACEWDRYVEELGQGK